MLLVLVTMPLRKRCLSQPTRFSTSLQAPRIGAEYKILKFDLSIQFVHRYLWLSDNAHKREVRLSQGLRLGSYQHLSKVYAYYGATTLVIMTLAIMTLVTEDYYY